MPDLTDQLQGVAISAASGKTVITGKPLVSNIGTAPASSCTVNYYLSIDNQLDASDNLLSNAKLALGARQHNVVTFNFSHSGAVSGEYLIAAISPNNSPRVVNSGNDIVAALIPKALRRFGGFHPERAPTQYCEHISVRREGKATQTLAKRTTLRLDASGRCP